MNTATRDARRPTRRILTPTEKERLERIVADDKSDKTETATEYPLAGVSKNDSPRIKNIKKQIQDGQPDDVSKHDVIAFEAEAKKLKEWLQKNMVPKSHIYLRPQKDGVQDYEFRKTANFMAAKEMSTEFQRVAERYKFIMRQLGRSEDANLESIRPDHQL